MVFIPERQCVAPFIKGYGTVNFILSAFIVSIVVLSQGEWGTRWSQEVSRGAVQATVCKATVWVWGVLLLSFFCCNTLLILTGEFNATILLFPLWKLREMTLFGQHNYETIWPCECGSFSAVIFMVFLYWSSILIFKFKYHPSHPKKSCIAQFCYFQ